MASSPAPAAPLIPLVRDCRPGGLRPLLAPGGRDTYFSPEVQRMLFPPDEALARFLPPAKWMMPERQEKSSEGKSPQVTYTIPDEIIKTASPLTTLPRAEIDAFSDAIAAFLAKARPDAKGVTPYMRQCRQEFRLPNPDFDPAAYWVYGPEFDRRLLILWGCEPQAGTSLPLDKVLEKLLALEMTWPDKQELACKLARRPDEPLSRFLAPRTADGGLLVNGVSVPAKKLKRFKTITPSECRAFEAAAKDYYAKAHPGVVGAAPFERELRRGFRLPSVELVPGDYYTVGSKLVIALDTWPKESTLPATDDAVLKLMEPSTAPFPTTAVASTTTGTVSGQLQARQQPAWVLYAKLAAAVVVLGAVGAGAWLLKPDRTPPEFRGVEAVDDKMVVLTFSKEIAKASLQSKSVAAGERAKDPLVFFDDKVKIIGRDLSTGDPRKVVVRTEEKMADGEKYGIAISQLTDVKGNVIAPSNAEFTYNDRKAPKLDTVSAGGKTKKNLLLVFNKPLAEGSLTPSRFAIFPLDGGQRGKRLTAVGAEFDAEDKTGATVILEANDDFKGGMTYVLDITGVTDRAVKPNQVDEKTGTNREFKYVNLLPPRLGDVVAAGGKYEIALTFNTTVDPAIAKDESNYTLTGPDSKPLRLLKGGIQIDETGTQVMLKLESQRLAAGKHQLVIANMADKLGNKTKAAITRAFEFNDATNRTPLALTEAKLSGTQLALRFDRALAQDTIGAATHYRILAGERRAASGIEVKSAQPVSGEAAGVSLQLSQAPGAGQYVVEVSGLADVFGNEQTAPATRNFGVSGVIMKMTSLIDWAQPPLLRGGGRLLVITISERVTKASAETPANYEIDPATVRIEKVESFKPGTEELPVTTVTFQLAAPATGPVTVAARGLILEAYANRGPQTLSARGAVLAP